MEFLERPHDVDRRGTAHPLVPAVLDAEMLLPPVLWPGTDRNWFIAGYPDVVAHFYPTTISGELTALPAQTAADFGELEKYLAEFNLNQTLTLIYMKEFYKTRLRRPLLFATVG